MEWIASGREATRENIYEQVNKGWRDILSRLIDDLEAMGWDGKVGQVKEKYGGLRFYVGHATEAMLDRIDQAEDESLKICERCGKPGELRDDRGWYLTLCDDHAQSTHAQT